MLLSFPQFISYYLHNISGCWYVGYCNFIHSCYIVSPSALFLDREVCYPNGVIQFAPEVFVWGDLFGAIHSGRAPGSLPSLSEESRVFQERLWYRFFFGFLSRVIVCLMVVAEKNRETACSGELEFLINWSDMNFHTCWGSPRPLRAGSLAPSSGYLFKYSVAVRLKNLSHI